MDTVNKTAADPFAKLLRREARTHFIACLVAFLILIAGSFVGLVSAPEDAVLLRPSPIGLIADFVTTVLMLTFFRVLYSIPLWFARPSIRRIGGFLLFTLAFGTLSTARMQQAIAARVESNGVRMYFPFSTNGRFFRHIMLGEARLFETPLVSSLEFPQARIRFAPAFHFDSAGQARLHLLFQSLSDVPQ